MSEDIFSPEGVKPKKTELFQLSPRLTTLKGKKIALYHNDKVASFPILKTVGKLLREKCGVTDIFEVHSKSPFSRHPESAIQEALKADAVFVADAD